MRRSATRRRTGQRIATDDAGELVHTVVRRRLQLSPVVHSVVTFVLRVIRKLSHRRTAVLRVVEVQIARLLVESEEERVRRSLARAVHVRNAVRTEALSPIVPARRGRRVDERKTLAAIRTGAFVVEIDCHVRNSRLPTELQQESRIIEW